MIRVKFTRSYCDFIDGKSKKIKEKIDILAEHADIIDGGKIYRKNFYKENGLCLALTFKVNDEDVTKVYHLDELSHLKICSCRPDLKQQIRLGV